MGGNGTRFICCAVKFNFGNCVVTLDDDDKSDRNSCAKIKSGTVISDRPAA